MKKAAAEKNLAVEKQRERPSKEEQLDQKILRSLIGHERKRRKTKTL